MFMHALVFCFHIYNSASLSARVPRMMGVGSLAMRGFVPTNTSEQYKVFALFISRAAPNPMHGRMEATTRSQGLRPVMADFPVPCQP